MQPRISRDGRRLAFTRALGGTADIWLHDVGSGATTQVTTDPDYDENPFWSPDGRRLLYGQRPAVVTIAGSADGTTYRLGQRLAVSTSGGTDPAWRQDGREMIYLAPDAMLMAVGVMLEGEAVRLGKPTPLFNLPADAGGWDSSWAAIPDLHKVRRGRGAACGQSAVSASDGLDGEPITPVSVLTKSLGRFLAQHSRPRKDRVFEIVRLRLSLEIARVAWISNHFQIREMLRSIRHTIRGSGPSVQRTAELAMAVEQRKKTKE